MTRYKYSELPPNHRAVIELVKSLKIGTIIDTGDTVIISYANRSEVLIVEVDENVQSNPVESDRKS